MGIHILNVKKTWRQRLKESSPQVKAALIATATTVVLAIGGFVFQHFHYANENSRLKQDNDTKTAKIQELEFELTPFRTLSVQKFNKADAESLKELANLMVSLQKDYSQQINTMQL